MPTQICDDWEAVKSTAVALGSIGEAADRHGVTRNAAYVRAKRENWPVGRRVHRQLEEARERAAVAVVATGGVRCVSSADIQAEANRENSARSRSAALRYTVRTLEHVADLDPETALASAPNVAAVVKVAASAGDWQQQASAKVSVNIFTADPFREASVEGRTIESE